MSLWKHGFNGEDYTIGLSAQEVIPMVSGNTADIFSLWISHPISWVFGSGIIFTGGPILQF